jgi:hypothetical protein
MQPYVLLWLRYTAFILLYPLGVGSELAMVALAMPSIRQNRPLSIQASRAPAWLIHAKSVQFCSCTICQHACQQPAASKREALTPSRRL